MQVLKINFFLKIRNASLSYNRLSKIIEFNKPIIGDPIFLKSIRTKEHNSYRLFWVLSRMTHFCCEQLKSIAVQPSFTIYCINWSIHCTH